MRPASLAAAFVVLGVTVLAVTASAAPLPAEWESGWDTSFALSLAGAGAAGAPFAGFAARLERAGLTALGVRVGLAAGLRLADEGERTPSAMPWTGLSVGVDARLGSLLVLSPFVAVELRLPLRSLPPAPALGLGAGVSLGLRLSERDSLRLSLEAGLGAMGDTPAFGSLSFGIRRALAAAPRAPSASAAGTAAPDASALASEATEGESAIAPPAQVARPSWAVRPTLFSPDGDGRSDTLVMEIRIPDRDAVASWRFEVLDRAGALFHSTGGEGAPPDRLEWDGKGTGGMLVESAREYALRLLLADTHGATIRLEERLLVDILVVKDGDRYRIRLPSIEFLPDSAEVEAESGAAMLERNRAVLTKLAEVLGRFPGYSIVIEGHANSVYWRDPERAAAEQRDELVPLSLRRARAVRDALVALGVDPYRMAVVGRGGSDPIVPFSDEARSGSNRRVDVILVK